MSVSAFHTRTIGKKEIRILKTCFRINEIFNRVFTRIYIYKSIQLGYTHARFNRITTHVRTYMFVFDQQERKILSIIG